MRFRSHHIVAFLVLAFILKIFIQAQDTQSNDGVPKSLLLSSLSTAQPIPASKIDTTRIMSALRKE